MLRRELASRDFNIRRYGDDGDNLDMFNPRVVVLRAPYTNMYGGTSYSEFVITDGNRKIRAECRWQERSGSVDEKFPYLLMNAVNYMPENEVLILYGGDGAKKRAIDWLRREALKVSRKKIYVVNVNELPRWVRSNLLVKESA